MTGAKEVSISLTGTLLIMENIEETIYSRFQQTGELISGEYFHYLFDELIENERTDSWKFGGRTVYGEVQSPQPKQLQLF